MSEPKPPRNGFRFRVQSSEETARDIEDELAMHMALRESEFRAQGMSETAAREAAHRRFGNVEQARSELSAAALGRARRVRLRDWVASVVQDAAFGVRSLKRERGFSTVALGTLVLGFGAAMAVATVAYRYLVQPLALPGAERLQILDQYSKKMSMSVRPSTALFTAWQTQTSAYELLEGLQTTEGLLRENSTNSTVAVSIVTPGMLTALSIVPVVGRNLIAADTMPGNSLVGMLPWRVWKERYGSNPNVIGTVVYLDNRSVEIIGVLPKAFDFAAFNFGAPPRLWLPYRGSSDTESIYLFAIPRPGVSVKAMEAALAAARPEVNAARQELFSAALTVRAKPLTTQANGRRSVILVLAMACGVLLIACVNVAHLLLARGATRKRELSVRAALGAGRTRILRQLMTESAVLAVTASAGGLLVAIVGLRLAERFRPQEFAAIDGLRIDARMVALSVVLAMFAATVFGLLPALLGSHASDGSVFRTSSRTTTGGRGVQRLRDALAFSEIAVSVVLLIGAGLLTRSTWQLYQVPLGYAPNGVLSVDLELPGERFASAAAITSAISDLRRRVLALPGVSSTSIAGTAPHTLSGCFCELMPEGAIPPEQPQRKFLQQSRVDTSYFSLLHLSLVAGRNFLPTMSSLDVIISETTARKLWPGNVAVGQRLRLQRGDTLRTVVGVVSDLRTPDGFTVDDNIQLYFPKSANSKSFTLLVRGSGDASRYLSEVSRTIVEFDPSINIRNLGTAEFFVDRARAQAKFTMIVFSTFAGIALVLASVGLYGVLAYSVEQRRGEIGVRMAMGASRSTILLGVLRQGAGSTVAGLVAGVVAAGFASRSMGDLLFEIDAKDPVTYVSIVFMLTVIALLAMLIPARRASHVDPAIILRSEV